MRIKCIKIATILLLAVSSLAAVASTRYTGYLKCYKGGYTYADQGGGGFIGGGSPNRSDWELVDLIDIDGGDLVSGDKVNIRAYHGQFWSAANMGGGALTAWAPWSYGWETFTIVKKNGSGVIHQGDQVGFMAFDGVHFATVRYDIQGSPVMATAPLFSDWETFGADIKPISYDRYAAVDYAGRYYGAPNPDYHLYDNDCTNFVSQCLLQADGNWYPAPLGTAANLGSGGHFGISPSAKVFRAATRGRTPTI